MTSFAHQSDGKEINEGRIGQFFTAIHRWNRITFIRLGSIRFFSLRVFFSFLFLFVVCACRTGRWGLRCPAFSFFHYYMNIIILRIQKKTKKSWKTLISLAVATTTNEINKRTKMKKDIYVHSYIHIIIRFVNAEKRCEEVTTKKWRKQCGNGKM